MSLMESLNKTRFVLADSACPWLPTHPPTVNISEGLFCLPPWIEYPFHVQNLLSVTANLLVIIAIGRKPNNTFLIMLLYMSWCDIFSALAYSWRIICTLHELNTFNYWVGRCYLQLYDTAITYRVWILINCSFDRYNAVCKPHDYRNCWITRHTHKLMITGIVIAFIYVLLRDIFLADELCLSNFGHGLASLGETIVILSYFTAFSSISLILIPLFVTYRKLNTSMSRLTRRASVSIIRTAIAFGTCHILICIEAVLYLILARDLPPHWIYMEVFGHHGVSSYGLVNSIILLKTNDNLYKRFGRMFKIEPQSGTEPSDTPAAEQG